MASKFTTLDDGALVTELARKRHALVTARFQLSMNRLDNTSQISVLRKDIARLQTEVRRREIAAALPKHSLERNYAVDPASLRGGTEAAASGGFLKGVVDKLAE